MKRRLVFKFSIASEHAPTNACSILNQFFDSSSQRLPEDIRWDDLQTRIRAESLSVWTSKLEAARIWFADGSRRAGWSELDHEIHQRFRCALISNHVHVTR